MLKTNVLRYSTLSDEQQATNDAYTAGYHDGWENLETNWPEWNYLQEYRNGWETGWDDRSEGNSYGTSIELPYDDGDPGPDGPDGDDY